IFGYRDIGTPFYERLVKPNIVKIIEEELRDPVVPCIRGQLVPLSKAVIYDERIRDLIEEGLLTEGDLVHIYREKDLRLVNPDVKLRPQDRVRKLRAEDLLNKDLIRVKLEGDLERSINLLSKVYKKVNVPHDDEKRYIITKAGNIVTARDAYIGKIPEDVIELSKQYPEIEEFLQKLNYVHDHLLETLGIEFLKSLGVKEVGFQEVCNRVLLPKITADKPPDKEELLTISAILMRAGIKPAENIWVVVQKGEMRRSSEVYYPHEYFKPLELLEKLGFKFLDMDEYARFGGEAEWWKFFESAPIKGKTPSRWTYYSGYQLSSDYQDLIERIVGILSSSKDKDGLITYTRLLKRLYMKLKDYLKEKQIVNVLTDEGVRKSDEAFLHSRYLPREDWMKWKEFYGVGPFVSDEYIDDDDIQGWREFFVSLLNVKEEATSEQVERFAERYLERKLREKGYKILTEHGEGFDYEVEKENTTILIEVKGRKKTIDGLDDITLTDAETKKALECKGKYWVAVLTNIPNDPTLYVVKDPIGIERIVIRRDDIKKRGELWN
ncbi:MAG: DUF3883 domain-containing protein, partial [Candidatus Jordarchaeales archaeon]